MTSSIRGSLLATGLAGSLAVLTGAAAAADAAPVPSVGSDETNEQKYAEKLAKPFVAKIEWLRDLDTAKRAAAESDRLVFGYFTRSYAP